MLKQQPLQQTPAGDAAALVLLHPQTREPFAHKQYRLHLSNKVIEGMTDAHGATRPLSVSERESLIAWHVEGVAGLAV